MKFNYTGRTKEGKPKTGIIEAYSKEGAAMLLQKYNIFVTSLEEEATKESFLKKIQITGRVSKKELAVFFRQLSLMLDSRVPVVQSISSLAIQSHKPSFQKTIEDVANLVQEGIPLSEAFATHPKIFNTFYVNLIRSGETSGKISQALYYVSEHIEKEADILAQVRQVMIYPILVVIVFCVVIFVIIKFLIPKIADIIKETGMEPSTFTVLMLNFYAFLEVYWWLVLISFALIGAFLFYYFTTKSGKENFNRISLKTPLLKDYLTKVFIVRFCTNISTLLTAGISINKALKMTGDTINNIVYKEVVSEMEQRVSEGEKMSSVMARHVNYFPVFVIQMVRVGEDTGKLDKVLVEIVNFYQKEIKNSITLFASLLEPAIIIVLGIIVTILASSIISLLYGTLGSV